MDVRDEVTEKGVVERRFDLKVQEEVVPGIHWLPERAGGPHPTVLIGHGGTQHKRTANVLGLARMLVRHIGVGVVALDAPEHGERVSDPEAAKEAARRLADRVGSDGGAGSAGLSDERRRAMAARIPGHVAEWRALLDEVEQEPAWGSGPFGWWGVSMGTSHGLPLVAEEPRITCAVLGLNALRPGDTRTAELAARVRIPVLYLFQWDDQLMSREAGMALWDALGSEEKTMHVNPGGHVGMPLFERQSAESFFARHLL